MVLYCWCMLAGAFSLGLFRELPADLGLLLCSLLCAVFLSIRKFRPFAFFLLGFIVMAWAADGQLADRLDPLLVRQDLVISALVEEFPVSAGSSLTLVVRPLDQPTLPERIRLSWYEAAVMPEIGELWRLRVRLKRPRGYSNPGGFDFEGWLFREKIGATGYVDNAGPNYRIHGQPAPRIDRVRRQLVVRLADTLPHDAATGVLMAITAGARHRITSDQWDLYARTGTSHLMAISGLHIGLAASFAYFLGWGALSLIGKRGNYRDASLVAAVIVAVLYATLSGFAVPARRALLMAAVASIFVLLRRQLPIGKLTAMVGLVVFIADPLAILTPGYQLSFAAVVILIVFSGQHVRCTVAGEYQLVRALWSGCKRLAILQVVLMAALFPFTVLIFDRFALIGPLINLLILPIFNLLSVPLSLAGLVFDGPLIVFGDQLLRWAHSSVSFVLKILEFDALLPTAGQKTRQLSALLVLCAFLPLSIAALPPGWPGRRIAIVAIVAVAGFRPAPPPVRCLQYSVLDVGQGLSVVLQTANQTLVFDTGPAFRTGSDTGQLVVLPFLYNQGIDEIDRLVVSHGDLDHAGGVQSLLDAIPVKQLLVGERLTGIERRQTQCIAGISWRIDGVSFSVLHPRIRAPWKRNNASCVLEVTVDEHRLLLSGDIEAPVEKLLQYRKAFRNSDVVVVPHHGSRTSSTDAMVLGTSPDLAIVTTGFGNQWGFPKGDVVARWQVAGATVINTAVAGAATQRLCAGMPAGAVRLARPLTRKYWHDVP